MSENVNINMDKYKSKIITEPGEKKSQLNKREPYSNHANNIILTNSKRKFSLHSPANANLDKSNNEMSKYFSHRKHALSIYENFTNLNSNSNNQNSDRKANQFQRVITSSKIRLGKNKSNSNSKNIINLKNSTKNPKRLTKSSTKVSPTNTSESNTNKESESNTNNTNNINNINVVNKIRTTGPATNKRIHIVVPDKNENYYLKTDYFNEPRSFGLNSTSNFNINNELKSNFSNNYNNLICQTNSNNIREIRNSLNSNTTNFSSNVNSHFSCKNNLNLANYVNNCKLRNIKGNNCNSNSNFNSNTNYDGGVNNSKLHLKPLSNVTDLDLQYKNINTDYFRNNTDSLKMSDLNSFLHTDYMNISTKINDRIANKKQNHSKEPKKVHINLVQNDDVIKPNNIITAYKSKNNLKNILNTNTIKKNEPFIIEDNQKTSIKTTSNDNKENEYVTFIAMEDTKSSLDLNQLKKESIVVSRNVIDSPEEFHFLMAKMIQKSKKVML